MPDHSCEAILDVAGAARLNILFERPPDGSMPDQDRPQIDLPHGPPHHPSEQGPVPHHELPEGAPLHKHLGAIPQDGNPQDGKTHFSVWAPNVDQITVELVSSGNAFPLRKQSSGYHTGTLEGVKVGERYFYRGDGGPKRPDPASRFQPDGVHGPSEVIDAAEYDWTDQEWKCPDRDDLIIYELHIGTFTDDGTFLAGLDRLDELVDLGITAIELMPVAACAGRWNWGYDGVALFAPMEAYGTPDDFRKFVDAAHSKGIAVFLDVVYNHLGPEGNYLHDFGPYLSDHHNTVWGDAPNFDDPIHGDSVRQWFVANAIYWLDEFHLDGLRVDAIHCMKDDREPHVAAEMSQAVQEWSRERNRNRPNGQKANGSGAILIAESNVYDPEMTLPRTEGGIGFDAMWGDDFLHSTFAILRPGEQLSNRKYRVKSDLQQVLKHGYIYEGTIRQDRQRKELQERVETHGLIYSIQNHDFIGNHPLGDRLHRLTSHAEHRAAAALLMLTPAIPMLFQGEEFASPNPFRFFVDFSDPNLRQAVVDGRRREYPQHDWDAGVLPTDRAAFDSAKIGRCADGNAKTLQWYKALIAVRKETRSRGLLRDSCLRVETDLAKDMYVLHYENADERLSLLVRLGGSGVSEDSETDELNYQIDGRVILNSLEIGCDPRLQDHVCLQANHAVVIEKPALAK